jgi:MFS family permease
MTQPVTEPVAGPRQLLAKADFRRVYLAGAAGQLGDAFQFVALLWYAVVLGGPLGVMVARVATTLPFLLFGLHGGLTADRWDRRRTMIAADLVRGVVLVPVAAAGLTGNLPLWGLIAAGFLVATASAYFNPALGAFLPGIVERRNVQQANGLVTATNNAALLGGWAVASALLTVVSIGSFFAINAASYFVSAGLIARTRSRPIAAAPPEETARPRLLAGVSGMRVRPGLRAAVAMHALGVTVNTGVWTVGVAEVAHSELGSASGLSLILTATAVGAIAAGAVLSKLSVPRKVFLSCLSWCLLLPGYLLLAVAGGLSAALVGTFLVGVGTGAAFVLMTSATQESVEESVLGRAMGIISLGSFGAKPIGLLLIAPFYAFLDPGVMFLAGGVAVFVSALVAAALVDVATRRYREAAAAV